MNFKLIKKVLSYFPVGPILLSVAFVLGLFQANIGELRLNALIIPLIGCLIFAITVSLVFAFLTQDKRKGIIYASIFSVIFFLYGEVYSYIGIFSFKLGPLEIGKNDLLFLVWCILLTFMFLLIRRTNKHLHFYRKFIRIISIFAVVFPLIGIFRYEIVQRNHPGVTSPMQLPVVDKNNLKNHNLPDIYYIVPEDYSSPNVLSQYFHYDSSGFIKFLKDTGFYVADQSTSNYPKSFLSISSTLNMEYLDYLSVYKNSSDQTIVNPLFDNNNLMKLLRMLGYNYYQMGSWWEPTNENPYADANYTLENESAGGIDEFNYTILKSTMLRPFIMRLLPDQVITESDPDKRKRILYQFAKLPDVENLPSPKFVFVHIIAPHGPYVFGKDCEFQSYKQIANIPEEVSYVNQVNCIDHKLEDAINTILSNSVQPPVILLQTDEGAPFLGSRVKPEDNWSGANPALLQEKFPIMAAYYLPGLSKKAKSILYPSITPVNSFRIISNLYFATKFPLLPDKNYIFPDMHHLYDFREVTTEVNGK